MAASGPAQDRPSTEEAQDERYVAALCRNARLRNEEIHKKREQLRKEIRDIQDQSYAIESRYWHEYHERLAHISHAHPKSSTREWISAFGDSEKMASEAVAKCQAKLREDARLKQEELAGLDGEFWGSWSRHVDVMRGLSPLPPSSGSTPAAPVPIAAPPQPADIQESGPSPATPSHGSRSQSDSEMHIANEQEQRVSGTSSAASQPLPEMSTAVTNAASDPGHSLSQAAQGQADDVMQSVQSASPFATPAPISLASSPGPSIPASASKQRRRLRSSTTTSSPGKQHGVHKTRSRAPSPRSLTPKSAITSVENQAEPSQEPADDAQPSTPQKATAAEPQLKMSFSPINTTKQAPPALPKLTIPQNQDDGFIGVTDPVVGEIYQAFYKDQHYEGWWMCTVLPWDAWDRQIGINFSFHQAGLFRDLPDDCYAVDRVPVKPKSRRKKNVITGWKKGFEAGGARVRERVFPVLFFDDKPGDAGNYTFPASHEKPFSFSKQALRALPAEWVPAANLRLPGVDVGRPVAGRDTAERFRERVRARRALQARKKVGTPRTPRTPKTGSAGPAEASPAADASSPAEASFSAQDTSREDTEMADAESLSGATAVDDTAGQSDVLESDKADSAVKSPSAGPAKKWRAVVLGQDT